MSDGMLPGRLLPGNQGPLPETGEGADAPSAHVAGVTERVPAGLRPHGEAVRLLADGNRGDLAAGRVEDVDDVVVAPGKPEALAVRADVAHVGAPPAGDRPRLDHLARGE